MLVLLDADGALISASDAVVHRREEGPAVRFGHETVGGRFEPDGRFAGRHWTSVSVASPEGDAPPADPPTGREPTPAEIEALRALAAEVMRRAVS